MRTRRAALHRSTVLIAFTPAAAGETDVGPTLAQVGKPEMIPVIESKSWTGVSSLTEADSNKREPYDS